MYPYYFPQEQFTGLFLYTSVKFLLKNIQRVYVLCRFVLR